MDYRPISVHTGFTLYRSIFYIPTIIHGGPFTLIKEIVLVSMGKSQTIRHNKGLILGTISLVLVTRKIHTV